MTQQTAADQTMDRAGAQTLRLAGALAWEFWARGWPGILAGPAAALILPGLILAVWMPVNRYDAFLNAKISVEHFTVYYATVLALGSVMLLGRAKPKFELTLPAPSFLLVACPLVCAMVTIFVQYAIVALIVNAVFHVAWSILGPGLLAAALIGWSLVVLWSTANSFGLRALACLGSIVALSLAGARWGPAAGDAMDRFLPQLSPWHALFFGLATVASVAVGTLGFASLRRGYRIDFGPAVNWLSSLFRRSRAIPVTPFSSPPAAQLWLEWMQRGYALPLVIALLGIAFLILAWTNLHGQVVIFGEISAVHFLSILPLIVMGIFWGARSSDFTFGNFSGSRPLSDRQLAAAVLKSATLSLIVATLIWFGFISLMILGIAVLQGADVRLTAGGQFDPVQYAAMWALIGLIVWSAVGVTTSVALAGKKVMRIAFGLIIGAWILGVMLPRFTDFDPQSAIIQNYVTGCFFLYLLACGAAFVVSWRQRLIASRTLWLAAAIVLMMLVASHYAHSTQHSQSIEDVFYAIAFCSLVPAPLAAAPLAVYFNRHR